MIKLKEFTDGWEKQPEWHGNPELGYDSYRKFFKLPNGRKVPVYVFGKEGTKYGIHFVVSAGRNSPYSYSEGFYPESPNFAEAMDKVDKLYIDGKLIR